MAKQDSNGNPIRQSRGLSRQRGTPADWQSADAALVIRAICVAASTGGALRFGYTADGGAYAVGIYGDGPPYTHYTAPGLDINQTLQDIVDLFEGIADDAAQKR